MNIILGQSFNTRSVIPQLVIVTPTRFLDFNTRTYKEKHFKRCVFLQIFFFLKLKCFHWHKLKSSCYQFFLLGQKNYKDGNFSHYSGTWLNWKLSGVFSFTCTWSSSITGSLVLVDLSAVRFRFMAWRGFVLATSRKRQEENPNFSF